MRPYGTLGLLDGQIVQIFLFHVVNKNVFWFCFLGFFWLVAWVYLSGEAAVGFFW